MVLSGIYSGGARKWKIDSINWVIQICSMNPITTLSRLPSLVDNLSRSGQAIGWGWWWLIFETFLCCLCFYLLDSRHCNFMSWGQTGAERISKLQLLPILKCEIYNTNIGHRVSNQKGKFFISAEISSRSCVCVSSYEHILIYLFIILCL